MYIVLCYRLEAAFYEQALRYYGNHAKKIRIVKVPLSINFNIINNY